VASPGVVPGRRVFTIQESKTGTRTFFAPSPAPGCNFFQSTRASVASLLHRHGDTTVYERSDAYNRRLSYRRAVAVQQYLSNAHGLPRARLPVVGRGKAALYDPAHPFAPSNRRVEFVNVTDSAPRS
jgi:hypothetical protein